ncbi:hypothetical protein [Desulfofalx alkaliphila]|uniref:hypothetical protein n=1 Tax=Desulfofalx alkaliphila TaxID=105483 RepID=UPI0004E159BE|nr:hypothetical protein [Desulfofalx alkaliphila]
MAFVNQFQATQFAPRKLKTLQVLCQECVQEIGDLFVPLAGVTDLDDIESIAIEPVDNPMILTTQVLPGKVVNIGVVPALLEVELEGEEDTIEIPVQVPFQGEVVCPGIMPGEPINVQKHDIQLEGLVTAAFLQAAVDAAGAVTQTATIIVKAVVRACVIVSREELLKINAASQFCPCP